mgnify:CR=1 FL=1
MKRKVTKAIFPVAGLGTRFLPATKSIPKEIMTLVDRPLIQYAIDEARAAGLKEFIFVTSRGTSAPEDYFDAAPVVEAELRRKGKKDLLELLKMTNMESGAIAYIRQQKALGLGHAHAGQRVIEQVFEVRDRQWRGIGLIPASGWGSVSYTHLRAHETVIDLVCRLLPEKKKPITTSFLVYLHPFQL